MKEWLIKMAKELGLPDGTPDAEILAKLSERLLSGGSAEGRLSSVAAQLAAQGLKLDGDKVVKLESVPGDPADKRRIAILELESAKTKLAAGKTMVDAIMAGGKVPPALKDALNRVFSTTGQLESLALSKDAVTQSEVVIKGTVDILADLKAIFEAIPGLTGGKLSTLSVAAGAGGAPETKPEDVGKLGKAVAARMSTKKENKK